MAPGWRRWAGSRAVAYATALTVPLLISAIVGRLGWPPFVFEHLIVLLVVAVAIRWGMAPAVLTGVIAVGSANVVLREPAGQPTISELRDVFELVLFLSVAVAVGWLVSKARREQERATEAAERERRAREDRDRLVATISHDLATPLNAIRGTIQFARRFGQEAEIDLPRLLERMDTAAARATSLVTTLADAQAIERRDLTLKIQRVDVLEIVAPIVRMFDRASDRHPVVLAHGDAPLLVDCDAARLQRVIENLISNAIKYSPHGGTVEVSLAVAGPDAVIAVRDHGIGISAEAVPHVFERSYRAPEAASAAPGLGLGLAISAEIVRRHGGTIAIGRADPGTVVTVRLPRASSDSASDLRARAG